MTKKFSILCLCILISSSFLYSKKILLDNFDDAILTNHIGGANNTWINNPNDKTIVCNATSEPEIKGSSLRLAYDIDSALTYLSNADYYILDYSDYSIIGFASQIPHTAFCGYYFLLRNADLSPYRYLVFYVRGNEEAGYTRRFKIELKTKNQTSSYIIDGVTNKWKRFVIPLNVFEKILNWQNITELTIVLNEIVTDKKGILYFDDFYFTTDPNEVLGLHKLSHTKAGDDDIAKIFIAGDIGANYRYTPERKNEIFHSESLTLEGQSGRISARMSASFDSQEFGESAYMENTDNYPFTEFHKSTASITLNTVQLKVERLNPLLNKITLGNIWIGYSPYIISPFWGWKGISVKGSKDYFTHDTFLIKRPFNSFSIGNRSLFYIEEHRLKLVGLYDYKTADLGTGTLQDKGNRLIKPVSSEYSYLVNTLFRFFNYKINCELSYGYCSYKKKAEADYSNPQWPAYSHKVSSKTVDDTMYETKLFFDGIGPGTKFVLSYRDIGTDFKPEYRQEPFIFEDVHADLTGYNLQLKQWYKNYNLNLYWDDVKRKSNKDYYRNVFNYGVGYIGSRDMEFKINRELKRDKYKIIDESVESIIVSFQYGIIYPVTPGLRQPLTPKVIFREDNIHHKSTDSKYTTHSLEIDLNFRLETDFGFSVNYKTTKYADPSWEPKDDYGDNCLNGYFSMRF